MKVLDKCFTLFIYGFIILFILVCIIPFWMVIIDSFASESSLQINGYQLFPTHFSLYAYQYLFKGKQIFHSYGVTLFVTIVGTILAVFVTATFAYVLAHRKVKYRNTLSFLTYLTMIFGAGLVGSYILIANWLGLKDSIWALILPYLLNPFYAFILVAFYRTIPYELNEAATIDGANDLSIFFRIIWPVAVPSIASITLFYALQYWNDWFLALMYIDNYKLHPLQIMIRQLISNTNMQSYISGGGAGYDTPTPQHGVQLATVCITIGPIILFYPFIQKFFVNGLTVGAVKG
jgi:putative aldouronate transport system permease protein